MPIESLDHYTIKTIDVEATARFYEDVIGLVRGPSPALDFPILWLYAGDKAVLHVVGRDAVTETDGGCIDHVAFRCSGYRDIKARLDANGVEQMEQRLAAVGVHQIFAKCADGTWVELIFDPKDVDAAA